MAYWLLLRQVSSCILESLNLVAHAYQQAIHILIEFSVIEQKDRGGVTAAFEKDDFEMPNVQINFVQHDLACKQRALEQLEQRCQESVAIEERRRFAELATCLNPLVVSSTLPMYHI